MAGDTPEEAIDAFLERIQLTLACLSDCAISRSAPAPDHTYALTAFERGKQAEQNLLRLITHNGTGEVHLRFSHLFRVVSKPDDDQRGPFKVSTSAYHYRILDVADNEIALYHWHPRSSGPVTMPHLHVPGAAPMQMVQPFTSTRKEEKTHLGKMHFPTARIFLEDIVEFLIRDFHVVPLAEDVWNDVLQENRAAIERGRTW